MVKIDLFKLYQLGDLDPHSIIDLSDEAAQMRYFNGKMPSVCMSSQAQVQEVLLMWRAALSLDAFEVLRTYVRTVLFGIVYPCFYIRSLILGPNIALYYSPIAEPCVLYDDVRTYIIICNASSPIL